MMGLCWHIHHDSLVEPVVGSIEERIEFVRAHKPAEEVELRLRLMRPVQGVLPRAFVDAGRAYGDAGQACDDAERALVDARQAAFGDAGQAYDDAWQALGDAWQALGDAWRAYGDARRAALPEIEALHRQECPDCPWDGETIFPGRHRR